LQPQGATVANTPVANTPIANNPIPNTAPVAPIPNNTVSVTPVAETEFDF